MIIMIIMCVINIFLIQNNIKYYNKIDYFLKQMYNNKKYIDF